LQFIREAIKAALYAHRKQMSKAQRRKKQKPVTNIYPFATERRYGTAIKAWLKPMQNYVQEYLKNNHEAILRGDSAALTRNDAVPGGSYRRLVTMLNGWQTTYLPELNDQGKRDKPPVVFMGLGEIAESLQDFNSHQWDKAAKANLGVEFPVYEDWWPGTKQSWAEENYKLIKKLSEDYIAQVNRQTELAVTNGWSVKQLMNEIRSSNEKITKNRARLIARDQIGKLNGKTTQARMEAVGLDLYEWSTSQDERVRDSHECLEGKICRWDDPTVYSDDGGKTWKDRPGSWCQLHPGYDIQCRCTALSYWAELVNEVDKEIFEEEHPGEVYQEEESSMSNDPDNVPLNNYNDIMSSNIPDIEKYQKLDEMTDVRLSNGNAEIIKREESRTETWYKEIPESQQYALRRYTASAFDPINKMLREGGWENVNERNSNYEYANYVKMIDQVMNKYANTEALITRRGVNVSDVNGFEVGGVYNVPQYWSTSLNNGFSKPMQIIIKAPPGSGVYIGNESSSTGERELILKRGLNYKVLARGENKVRGYGEYMILEAILP